MVKKLFFTGLLTATLAFAQGGMGGGEMGGQGGGIGGERGGGGMGGERGEMGGGMPRVMPTPMERIAAMLSLNKEQKKQVKSIMDDAQKESIPVRDQMLKGRQAIAQAVAAGKSQDEINAAITEYAASQTQMTEIELRAFTKIFLALEKDQQAKAPGLLGMMSGIFKGKNWDSNPIGPN